MTPSTSRGVVLAEEAPRSPRRRRLGRLILVTAFVAIIVAAYAGIRGAFTAFAGPMCQATAMSTSITFTAEQMDNAATITAIAVKRGLPARAATIALATAIQESKLRNISYGDRDSVGLFQQRPSQGWGTVAQLMDPVYATNAFYDALVKIHGYQTMEITKVAQAVQRSAAPLAYAEHETEGRVLASNLAGYNPGHLGCRLEDASTSSAADLTKQLRSEWGATANRDGATLTVTAPSGTRAWAIGSWAVAKAQATGIESVTIGSSTWNRGRGAGAYMWDPLPSTSPAAGATTVTITLH